MFEKIYLSRAQTRAMSSEMPIGDPTGGAAYGERNDPVTASIMAAATIGSGMMQSSAADKAADAQLEGTYAGIGEERRQFELGREDMAPYRKAGYGALDKLSSLISSYQPFDGTELVNDPGYQFGLREGRANLEQSAAARGNLFSTKTLRDLIQFGQDYAGTKYNERGAFRLGEQAQRYNQLAGVAGTGQTAAMGGAQLGAQSAGTIADLLTQGGNARAAGIVGGANAMGNAFSNVGNMYMQQSMLDRMGVGNRGVSLRDVPNAPTSGPFSAPGLNL